ncbi:unnamed protein product [Paramecium sonneborni]|uniref:Uncharacterized protein n=1 Tax=Paramecium sonneborni TaxID=65129 RepID=A0A8S1PN41_9CILI|nr:unnamed protein product [Paramecium sonneborni]
MQNQYGWNLLQAPINLSINANTTQLCLTDLPPQTRKVKLYICSQSGNCCGDHIVTWSLFTKVDITKVTGHPYDQNAWSVISDNCTLTLDERKIIEVSRYGNFPAGNFSISVQVLAYK